MIVAVHIRISTALLIVALLLLPFAAMWVPAPYLPPQPLYLRNILGWLYFEASPQLLIIAFLAAFISLVVLTFKQQSRGFAQYVVEMVVCVLSFIFIPLH